MSDPSDKETRRLLDLHSKVSSEVFANTRRGESPEVASFVCTDDRTVDALRALVKDCEGKMDAQREALAAYAHEAWTGWMRHLFERAVVIVNRDDGCNWTAIALPDRNRWARQMETPYADLSEEEKASDRAQADRMLAILDAVRR